MTHAKGPGGHTAQSGKAADTGSARNPSFADGPDGLPTSMPFEGDAKRLQLTSVNGGLRPCPEPGEETEQRLTLTCDGRVWLSRYGTEETDGGSGLLKRECFTVPRADAEAVLNAAADRFSREYAPVLACDAGEWVLCLTNTWERTFCFRGSLIPDSLDAARSLSDLIRERLKRPDLLVLDGCPDEVFGLEIEYLRPGRDASAALAEDCRERIVIDRGSGTLEHSLMTGGCEALHRYRAGQDVAALLDSLDPEELASLPEAPPDPAECARESGRYTLSFSTLRGQRHSVGGIFDRDGLPTGWEECAEAILGFLSGRGTGPLLDARLYGRPRRRASDLIFCHAVFGNGGRRYCYLADTDDYAPGDLAVVPVGADNHEEIVRIVSVEYLPPREAPFPLERIKRILRRYDGTKEQPLA